MAGSNQAEVSPDESTLGLVFSYSNKPPEVYVMPNAAGAQARQVTTTPTEAWRSFKWIDPKVITFKARDGVDVYARLFTPEMIGARRDPTRPGVVFVHGAGYLQNAHKYWSTYFREYMFHNLLAARGYVVLDVDYRASSGYGRDWRTAIYRHMGGKDLEDIVDGAKYLTTAEKVDPKRIGVYGGSYGGFITLMAMFTTPDVFAAGAALRPVTDWAHYNHGYTSNILNKPQKDAEAYRKSSPIYFAEGLKGALLICHGMVDTNVHFQDSVRLAQRLIELRKENWELAVYPVENHGFTEETSWADEYKRILKLFEDNLRGREREGDALMDQDSVLDLFRKSGALLEGHFRLSSGLHSDRYLQSALVLQFPEFAEALGHALAERTRHLQPTVVLSPALGGIVIGQEVGRALGVRAIFAERQDGTLVLRRGFTLDAVGPRAGRRGRHHDRRLDARDGCRGRSVRRAGDRRRRDHRSRLRSGAPQPADAGARAARGADLCARGLSALRQGRSRSSSPARGRRRPADASHDGATRVARTAVRTLKLTVEYRRHELRRLAASGRRRLDPGAARRGAGAVRGRPADGPWRRPDRRRRPRARPGRERPDAHRTRRRDAAARAERRPARRRARRRGRGRAARRFTRGSTPFEDLRVPNRERAVRLGVPASLRLARARRARRRGDARRRRRRSSAATTSRRSRRRAAKSHTTERTILAIRWGQTGVRPGSDRGQTRVRPRW